MQPHPSRCRFVAPILVDSRLEMRLLVCLLREVFAHWANLGRYLAPAEVPEVLLHKQKIVAPPLLCPSASRPTSWCHGFSTKPSTSLGVDNDRHSGAE